MPLKPAKWGMKLWCLCDAESGYCSAFSVYTGATVGNGDLDLGYRVVMGLMKKYLLSNHHVYADNFFTSVRATYSRQTHTCVTDSGQQARVPERPG
ncbi:hypothetical protein NP493_627g01014 [Ridgeia piscesae]|uniref:PiggyBac transposable element-derived protein domain-containing protein n=1 Tax=Ridgeia piscesae TaxID=27915 RepID=A0AAD9NQG7_RIDPI|nr:hypothetical protein NP493_627g01014 [Ridgeia piscesae]